MDAATAIDRMLEVFDRQQALNETVLQAVSAFDQLDDRRASDIAELREGLAALSNRVEGLTRYVMNDGPHSVKA
jgi:hypothetical protein